MLMARVHAASAELRAGRLPEDQVHDAMLATVLGAPGAPPPTQAPSSPLA
jgi:hypothetical protein